VHLVGVSQIAKVFTIDYPCLVGNNHASARKEPLVNHLLKEVVELGKVWGSKH
jgi:hypothetical protein